MVKRVQIHLPVREPILDYQLREATLVNGTSCLTNYTNPDLFSIIAVAPSGLCTT